MFNKSHYAVPGYGPVANPYGTPALDNYADLGIGESSALVGLKDDVFSRYRISERGEMDHNVGESDEILLLRQFILTKIEEGHLKMGNILPLASVGPGQKVVSWSVVEFVPGLLDQEAVKGPARTLKHGITINKKTLKRYGKMITGEQGDMKTRSGQQIMFGKIDQVIKATIETIALDKLRALLRAYTEKKYHVRFNNGPIREVDMLEIWRNETHEFSSATKNGGILAKTVNSHLKMFDGQPSPNALLLPTGLIAFVKLATARLPFAQTGEKVPSLIPNPRTLIDLQEKLESNPNIAIYEVPSFPIGENENWDGLEQTVNIGTYATMYERNRSETILHYSTRKAMTIYMEDQSIDNSDKVIPDSALKYCQLWTKAGLLDEKKLQDFASKWHRHNVDSGPFHRYGGDDGDDDDNGDHYDGFGSISYNWPPIHSFLASNKKGEEPGHKVTHVWGMTEERQFPNKRLKLCVESMVANKPSAIKVETYRGSVRSLDGVLRSHFPDLFVTMYITNAIVPHGDGNGNVTYTLDVEKLIANSFDEDTIPYGFNSWPGLLSAGIMPVVKRGGSMSTLVDETKRFVEHLTQLVKASVGDSIFLKTNLWGSRAASTHTTVGNMMSGVEELLYQFYSLDDVELLTYRAKVYGEKVTRKDILKLSGDLTAILVANNAVGNTKGEPIDYGTYGTFSESARKDLNLIRMSMDPYLDQHTEKTLFFTSIFKAYFDPDGDDGPEQLMWRDKAKVMPIMGLLMLAQIKEGMYLFTSQKPTIFDLKVAAMQAALVVDWIRGSSLADPYPWNLAYYLIHSPSKKKHGFWNLLTSIGRGEPTVAALTVLLSKITDILQDELTTFEQYMQSGGIVGDTENVDDLDTLESNMDGIYFASLQKSLSNTLSTTKSPTLISSIKDTLNKRWDTVNTLANALYQYYESGMSELVFGINYWKTMNIKLPLLAPRNPESSGADPSSYFYLKPYSTGGVDRSTTQPLFGQRVHDTRRNVVYGKKLGDLRSLFTGGLYQSIVDGRKRTSSSRATHGRLARRGFGSTAERRGRDIGGESISTTLGNMQGTVGYGKKTRTDLGRLLSTIGDTTEATTGTLDSDLPLDEEWNRVKNKKPFANDASDIIKEHNVGIKKITLGDLFNDNMKHRLNYANSLNDDHLVQTLLYLFYGCPITLRWFTKCLDNNWRFLGGFLLCRPNQIHVTQNAILTGTGPKVGVTYVGNPDIRQGQDADRKTAMAHFTVNLASVVLQPKMVDVISNVIAKAYIGGGDLSFVKNTADAKLERDDGPVASIISIYLSDSECDSQFPSPLDLLGYYNMAHVDNKTARHSPRNRQYINAEFYANLYGWKHLNTAPPSLTSYSGENMTINPNTVLFQDWQKVTVYNDVTTGSTQTETIPSTGHRGPHRYAGYNASLLGSGGRFVDSKDTAMGTYTLDI